MDEQLNETFPEESLGRCLLKLAGQGFHLVKVAKTGEVITISQAIQQVGQDGTVSAPAFVTEPQEQLTSHERKWWWPLPRTSITFIPGHVWQKKGEGQIARFYYGYPDLAIGVLSEGV